MGFFSSIGSVLGGIGGALLSPFTGGASIGIGAGLGGVLGSGLDERKTDARYNNQMSLAQAQMQFQQDYVKNALQWRAEDAKKAGFHPMAALGFSSPQYGGVSFPSIPGDTQSIDPMEFGQSLNYAATKAKDAKQQQAMIGLQMRGMELDNEYKQAQIDAIKVDTLASTIASDQALNSPPSPTVNQKEPTGLPSAPDKQGYIGEPEVQFNPTAGDPNVFTMNAGNDVTGLWEDKDIAGIIPLDLWPIIKANGIDYLSRLRGKIVNGMVYDNARGGWVSVNGPYGKSALADRLGLGRLGRAFSGIKKVINPRNREHFNPHDYARQFYTY